ncbi:ZinT/AdcA family metal-binding protein [Oceanobacillus sp. CFH 90083]|uniref:ZinT family metal-binding protein n=1 Tax=Oceanobacillus sp. CFH 90083 TaxID=2592336 RepID=UPI00128CC315|nr:ZinT/AdcA family metal-binding protein [Oceanobacillus sp. CFH 90083]
MKNFGKLGIILGLISFLFIAGCQSGADDTDSQEEETDSQEDVEANHEEEGHHDHGDEEASFEDAPENIQIEGLSDHYHTGDVFKLEAVSEEDLDHWHWYIRDSSEEEWTVAEDQYEDSYIGDANVDGQEVVAVLYNDDHEPVAKSPVIEITIDDHDGDVYEGYFDDEDVEDRDISDWAGEWKSVYPYFEEGALDEVYEHRAEESDDMSFEDYKEYYDTGYATSVNNIEITEDGEFTFHDGDETYSGTYVYDGYEILEYEAGNRGVRFIFKLEEGDDEAPQNIQFSDHIIAPQASSHFHLYWGDDRDELLEEVDHWPTYYPVEWSEEQIVNDLLLH